MHDINLRLLDELLTEHFLLNVYILRYILYFRVYINTTVKEVERIRVVLLNMKE
jgi:hypothetical protein